MRGEGVLETFGTILARTVQDLAQRYAILDVKEAAPARQWAEQALIDLFGTTRLGAEAAEAPPSAPPPSPLPSRDAGNPDRGARRADAWRRRRRRRAQPATRAPAS